MTRWEFLAFIGFVVSVTLVVFFLQGIQGLRDTGSVALPHQRCANNLKQIALALHNYHDDYDSFPPVILRNGSSAPEQSWRVLILPYLDQQPLHSEYYLDEPWDSIHNRGLHERLPAYGFHQCLSNHDDLTPVARTHYLAVIGDNTAWRTDRPVALDEFIDGTDQTILLVEVANSDVNWFEPRDLHWDELSFKLNDPDSLSPSSRHIKDGGWFGDDRPYVNVLLADGSVRKLPADTPPDVLQALLTINGGEQIDPPWLP